MVVGPLQLEAELAMTTVPPLTIVKGVAPPALLREEANQSVPTLPR